MRKIADSDVAGLVEVHQIVAGLECLCVPFGTIFGVMSLVLLTRDDVKAQFTG